MNEQTKGGFARADQYQIGGTHYKTKAIAPWEIIERNGMGFFDGTALKYLMRYKDKNGVDDLKEIKATYKRKLKELQA